jgi:hypothetical protein
MKDDFLTLHIFTYCVGCREEERRLARQPLPYPCQQAKTHTVFSHVANLMIEPVLYGPKSTMKRKFGLGLKVLKKYIRFNFDS